MSYAAIYMCLYILTPILSTDSKPTLPHLLKFESRSGNINILEKVGVNYLIFGTFLLEDKDGKKVEAIANEKGDVNNICFKILTRWLQGEGMQSPTWRTLIQVLRYSGLADLATEMEAVIKY